jgi:effector-binding domain-containing protein
MIETPQIVKTQAQPVAVIHLTVPRSEIQHVMGPGLQELMTALATQGITQTGPWLSHHLRMDSAVFDFEISIPVATPITPVGRVQASELPASTIARTIYHGPYEGLGSAWGEFNVWMKDNGHTPKENLWECYLSGPESSPDPVNWRTEFNRPLLR